MLVGIIGSLFLAFVPSILAILIAKYVSFAIFPYILIVGVLYFLRTRSKLSQRIKMFKSNVKFYCYIFFLYPVGVASIAYSNYLAMSVVYPYIYTSIVSDSVVLEAEITNKRLWGRRDRHEEIYVSGYTEGFPVTRDYYNDIKVGQKVKISISESIFGTAISFK